MVPRAGPKTHIAIFSGIFPICSDTNVHAVHSDWHQGELTRSGAGSEIGIFINRLNIYYKLILRIMLLYTCSSLMYWGGCKNTAANCSFLENKYCI